MVMSSSEAASEQRMSKSSEYLEIDFALVGVSFPFCELNFNVDLTFKVNSSSFSGFSAEEGASEKEKLRHVHLIQTRSACKSIAPANLKE